MEKGVVCVCECVYVCMAGFTQRDQHELHSDRGDLPEAEAACGMGGLRRGGPTRKDLGILLKGFGLKALKSQGI